MSLRKSRDQKTSRIRSFLITLLATLLYLSSDRPLLHAQNGIALIQHVGKDAGTTLSSTLAFPANNATGNWIGVVIRGGLTGQVFSVSDTRGNVYRRAIQFNETVDKTTLGIYYAENVAGGSNTVTVANSVSGTLRFA